EHVWQKVVMSMKQAMLTAVRWGCVCLLAGIVPMSPISGQSGSQADTDPDAQYVPGPDSQVQSDVPEGVITKAIFKSNVFEGTTREYWVYVPKQYDGRQPTCLMVCQDGHAYVDRSGQFRVPVVLDNVIHRGELPVTVAVFVNPGHHQEDLPE